MNISFGSCGFKASVALFVLGSAISSVQAATCSSSSGDLDDIPIGRTLGASMGATVASVIGATSAINSAIIGQGSTAFVSSPPNPAPDQQGGGVWTRGVGGSLNTSHALSLVVADVPNDGSGAADNANVNCTLKLHQTFAGMQVGADVARLNLGASGANIHFGLTGGYAELQSRDVDGGFNGTFQVPYLGIYSVFTKGSFFADAQLRRDFYQNRFTDPASGISNQQFNGTGYSVTANAGYNIDLGNSWFLEPSAGILYSHTQIDDTNVAGALLVSGPGTPGPAPLPATLHMGSIESLLGRFSLRVGTSVSAGGVFFTPFVTGGYYREFDSGTISSSLDMTSDLAPNPTAACNAYGNNGGDNCRYHVTLQTSRPLSFGQVSVGSSFALLDTGWLGYVRGDYRSGSDISGFAFSGGLRYQFTPFTAPIRAMPTKAPIIAARAYDWTGFYVGGFIGTVTADTGWSYLGATNLSLGYPFTSVHGAGFLGGGTWGYNKQFDHVVVGFETDLGWSNASGGRSDACPSGFLFTCETSLPWLATVTGRLGYAFDRFLIYTKGGLAVAELSTATTWNPGIIPLNPGAGLQPVPSATAFRASDTAVGWTLGGGFEFALTQKWSSKAEAMYYDLGSATYQLDAPVRVSRTGTLGRVGVNYHFN
jgi:opacity protein-like surface antigen